MTTRANCYDVPRHHARLFREYAEGTSEVARVAEAGDERAAGFGEGFMPELYHRLYAESPREVPADDRGRAAAVRAKLHALASELPEFETLRKQTTRDPMWSGMATAALADSVARAMPIATPTPDADKARQLLEGLRELADSTPEAGEAFAPHLATAENACDEAETAVETQAAGLDESAIRNALRAGIAAAADAIDQASSALAALGWSTDIASGATAKDPGVAVELAKRVRSSESLKRIVELAGRLTMTARAKRASRSEYARSEVVGVEPTGDVARLLPCELVSLSDPLLTASLYRRLLERAALGYKLGGTEKSAKGPIVIAIDQSYSMRDDGRDEWAKAVALAMLDAARAEKRAFGIVLYNGAVADSVLFPLAAEADPRRILDLLSGTPDGGTNFAPAITKALDWISTSGTFKRADVVHITDGEASTDGAEQARARAKALGAQIFGIAIGSGAGRALSAWSDEVTAIRDVSHDTAAVDLIFDNL